LKTLLNERKPAHKIFVSFCISLDTGSYEVRRPRSGLVFILLALSNYKICLGD
jgi:hypothetical protein